MFRKLFKGNKKPDKWEGVKDEHRIVKAFEFEGVEYFKFEDEFNLCTGRAFATLDYYEELRQRTTREYLQAFNDAINTELENARNTMVVTNHELDLNRVYQHIEKIGQLNKYLTERLDFIVDYETLYKLASVVFFTRDEQPYDYDFKYNREQKIPAFMRMGADFFLLMPVNELVPFGNMSTDDLMDYLKTQHQIHTHQLKQVLLHVSENFRKTESFKRLESWMNMDFPVLK